jgi:RNA polymerase sigma factor (sigma-70 family)
MPARADRLIRHVRRMVSGTAPDPATDAALLGRFVASRDEAAFEALVRRHGPMVLRVCCRLLADYHQAEDAFQATFLVLARKAGSVRPAGALAAWLHGVARRVARGARAAGARRRRREAPTPDLAVPAPHPDPLAELTAREALQILDEEVVRLSTAYRLPVVLCCLEGLSQEEAARRLGWTPGSVKGRLERGRARLHARLVRRGLTPAAALGAAELSRGSAPAALADAAVRRALAFAAGESAPGSATLLAEGVLREAALGRLKVAAALVLLGVGLIAAAGVAASSHSGTATPPASAPDPPTPAGAPAARVDGDGDPLPPGAILRLGSLRLRHRSALRSVAFAPGGRLLISGGWERAIRWWDPTTGKEVRQTRAPEKGVDAIAFSPDGKLLAGAALVGDVLLWDAASGRELRHLGGHRGQVHGITFSPKGDRLVSGDEAVARLWDVGTGKVLHTLEVGQGGVSAVAFSPDGRLVAAGDARGTAFVWEADTGKPVRQFRGEGNYVHALAFSPDGTGLLTAVLNGPAAVWDVTTGKPLAPLPGQPRDVQALAFSPDGKVLATGAGSGRLRLWEWPARKERWDVAAHPDGIHTLSFSPDGRTLASGSPESAIHLWDVATGKPLGRTAGHQERVTAVAYAPDGGTIFTGGWDRTVRAWDAASGTERATFLIGTEKEDARSPFPVGTLSGLAVAPDGKLLAVVCGDESVRFWELPSGKELYRLRGSCVAFAPDGRLFACGGRGTEGAEINMGVIRLHARDTGKLVRELHGHKTQITALAFTPDGKTLVSRGMVLFGMRTGEPGESETEFLRVWDVATGRQRRAFPGRPLLAGGLVLSPDGRTLVSFADGDKTILLLEMATGGARAEVRGHTDMLFQVAFAPDGRTLASGGMDGTVRLWDLPSGKEVARLEGHRGWVLSLAFSPDGRRLVSAGTDTTALVWDVARSTSGERPAARLGAEELRSAWQDLGGDAGRAYRAVGALAAAPEQAVPFLAERVRPAAAPNAKRVARLLADLDDERFGVREQASRELEALRGLAGPALREALAGRPSAEARRRLEELLAKLDTAAPTPEEVRAVRVVEVLEHAGTGAARRLLTDLAGGAAGARLTREATAARLRLAGRPTPKP